MARYFCQELIDQIKDSNDIVSIVSEYVSLKKKGQNYWGCCPFHSEKTPSFSVSPEKGFYYCFGCRATGNVFKFLMEMEHITFPEAVEQLANRANIALPEAELSPQQRQREAFLKELYEVNAMAATFFHNCLLQTVMAEEGRVYLKKRGLTTETIEKFNLGFAPPAWDKLYQSFTARGVSEKILMALHLIRKRSDGQPYDFFRNRIMFPITDGKGRVVGFGGRVMDDSEPKYLNSPESPIFDKGRLLFGFHQAYQAIRKEKQAILVEGYMDVISCHQYGVENAVASLGTAYTKNHGRLLMRQAEEVVLAYDMDGAGRNAARRAIDLLTNTDFKVRVLAMPDGKDPDDYTRNHGGQAFKELVSNAVTPFDYILNQALSQYDTNTLEGKQSVMNVVFAYLSKIQDSLQRENGLRSLAMPLWLDVSTVFTYFRQYLKKGGVHLENQAGPTASHKASSDEEMLMAAIIEDRNRLSTVLTYLPLEDFQNLQNRSIIEKLQAHFEEPSWDVQQVLDTQEYAEYVRFSMMEVPALDEAALYALIRNVRLFSLREQYKKHSMLADQLNRAGDSDFIVELHKCQEIQQMIQEWSK